ncbi:hypothetical protein FRAHR75_770028 [Frankia sp. Hr75.2]|nr:hypothetical protein FRAHR75_770028 [Frankia sp. Hr75.2]
MTTLHSLDRDQAATGPGHRVVIAPGLDATAMRDRVNTLRAARANARRQTTTHPEEPMSATHAARSDAAGRWAARTIDRVYGALSRTRVEACEHLVSPAILADLELDLDPADGTEKDRDTNFDTESHAAMPPGVARIPAAILCGRHLDRLACADCHTTHLDKAHHRPVRCGLCKAPGATRARHLDLHLANPLGIVHHAVPAKIGGQLLLDDALDLCDTCADRMPQDQLHPVRIALSDASHRP